MKMAFRRKEIKKAYYYVWFLGAKESKGLRGEQYILPVLRQLVNIERRTEPSKVTIQVSNKGIKIIQNVPKKQTLPNGQPTAMQHQDPQSAHQPLNHKSSITSVGKQIAQNPSVKMEQINQKIKHFIPHHAVTCALQSEDVVCIILLLYNPLTCCPVHVHGYRCDSTQTAITLCNQLHLLIERPENQRKFAEIESRLAAKGLISHQQLLNNNNVIPKHHGEQQIKASNQLNNDQSNNKVNVHQAQSTSTQLVYKQGKDSSRSKRNTLTSDGRSAEDEFNQSDDYSPTIRSEPDGQPSLNKSLVELKSSSGNSSGSSGSSPPPQAPNPIVAEMFENLATELKAKLGNPQTGPILLPPRDYDTVCRSQGKLIELDQRACTNKLVVGSSKTRKPDILKQAKKPENLILDTNSKDAKEIKLNEFRESNDSKKSGMKGNLEGKEFVNKKNIEQIMERRDVEASQNNTKLNSDELNEQARRLNHQRIREQQRLYEQKLKNLQKKQELYEQQQLLFEQQKQVKRELSQQHKPNKFIEESEKLKNKINSTKKMKAVDSKDYVKTKILSDESSANKNSTPETSAVIYSGGIKQIGSSLANKLKQSIIGSNKDKLMPQLICHKTIHDSLQSLNNLKKSELVKLTKSNDKFMSKESKPIDGLFKTNDQKFYKNKNIISTTNANTMDTSVSNSSSNISRDLNEKLNTMNSRSDSSNVSKSSGIGSEANLNKSNPVNYDDAQYLSTDDELDDELIINELNECVDEYMPNDFVYNQYLDDEIIDDLDEEVSNRVIRRMSIREKLLHMENENMEKKPKIVSKSTGLQGSSEEDDGTNSICYDENLMPKINTAKRVKKMPKMMMTKSSDERSVNNVENVRNNSKHNLISGEIDEQSTKSMSVSNIKPSLNQIKRSETYYEVNSDQKKLFHNNFGFPRTNKSRLNSLESSLLHQPKLFYFPNPEFVPSQHLIDAHIKPPQLKYQLGHHAIKQQCELRRQKSTPMLVSNGRSVMGNGGSVEKLISSDLKNGLNKYAHQRGRPISMLNVMQPEPFRISNQAIDVNAIFKRVPIFY